MSDDELRRRSLLKFFGATGISATIAGCGSDGGSTTDASTEAATEAATETATETATPVPTESLTLLHDTHVGGRLGTAGAEDNENIESYFGLMDDLTEPDRTLRLGAGDDLGSSALSSEFEGRHVIDPFEAGGLTHDTFGNHDFDFGPDVLRTRVSETEDFLWVSANVDEPAGEAFAGAEGAERYDLVEMAGVSVGITGVLTPRAREVTSLGDAEVRDPVNALSEVVPQMRDEGAEVVIVMSHVSNDLARNEIAPNVDGIDVIVGDDAAEQFDEAVEVDGTVLSFVGDEYDYLGEVTLEVGDDGIQSYDRAVYDVSEEGPEPNEAVEAVADVYRSQVDSEVIGESTVALNCVDEDLRTEETNMGNFVADAISAAVDADVVLQNGGGIRTGTLYPPGDLTDLLVRQILPFGNTTTELEVSGQTLHDALENGVSDVGSLEGRFPQVSGLAFAWDPEAEPGDRIAPADITVGGDQLELEATYALGTNNFVAEGGDGYDMLSGATRTDAGETELAQLVIDRIREQTPIAPETEGRISRL
ncbi:multifunctional 2',3'-cyclic-nucleotide 2'-phosphodiesterase/5'-nucleotidase/3'-nucleotidase [Halobellus salinus]|uniref:Multifunctional 2',3'-cyclic-nucleotide 2'-phosphodiesterase/5'-nucleotidase/3'-nucleotidase n=1 Tax=Halobellus salinus TaxID=931585 RepID=A0A830EFX7_9EURY|nr:5'-nucleotidase C-terminal domain-containing protein [Halobellus salinus]GGJ01229.1 multifunctional 2',3'-cyclic-nucleotide 2'-phosphodiesterase/5'-nucleotidase/3'-nucleotidase [Halobellus salinus]SMP00575.1 2',3'-cyclic-nucleotide 2'-phosphodiesterase / 3'-nucleotidase [Halobellus salinus]